MARRNSRPDGARAPTAETVAEAIEAYASTGALPWRDPLAPLPLPHNVAEGEVYKGANVLALWSATLLAGYDGHEWGTRAQWAKRGRGILPGEKPTICATIKPPRPVTGPQWTLPVGQDGPGQVYGSFSVFNATQTDGYVPPERPPIPRSDRFARAAQFFDSLGLSEPSGRGHASSNEAVNCAEACKAAVGNLIAGHGLEGRFGGAAEGFAVEIGAALLCASLGIEFAGQGPSVEDARSWARLLVSDSTVLFVIAGHAQRAVDSLHALCTVCSQRTAGPRHSTLQTAKNNEKYAFSRSPTP